jgi:hypothetical protein
MSDGNESFASRSDIQKSLHLNSEGIFPGTHESLTDFFTRAMKLKESKIAIDGFEPLPKAEKQVAQEIVKRVYDIQPAWTEVVYGKKGLRLWEAACTWFDEESTFCSIQIASYLRKKESLFGLYTRDEILAHEYVHVARAPFLDSKFEEYFSYYITRKASALLKKNRSLAVFQATIGTLFSSPHETLVFVALMALVVSIFLFQSIYEDISLSLVQMVFALPFINLLFLILRASYYHRIWCRSLNTLKVFFQSQNLPDRSLHLLLRLSEKEMRELAAKHCNVHTWIHRKKEEGWRWEMLFLAYIQRAI